MTQVFWILSSLVLGSAQAVSAPNPIGNFREVVPGSIYRGELPGEAGVAYLAEAGFKTILNLKTEDDEIEDEARLSRALGLNHLSYPLSPLLPLSDRAVNASLAALGNPALYPIFVHCRHGRDRTGLIVGLHRVERQGWSPEDAYDEMLRLGFRTQLIFLDYYFRNRTGLDD